ncbi:hypothetical protein DGMP_18560 [Desulfomarina profundi]|uniref:Uncharacterized protein n=1 Tax=Desulfomarina profundi TaxID=2772557 RepID=A0A8D5FLF7_9BACT|nr:hypothetical protein DGMP_18560 [Desulfomarina profundi]
MGRAPNENKKALKDKLQGLDWPQRILWTFLTGHSELDLYSLQCVEYGRYTLREKNFKVR